MNSRSGEGEVDRLAIAEQVIVSAGNILVAAGFGREEIGSFFRQAAEQLGAGADGDAGERVAGQAGGASPAPRRSARLAALLGEFHAIPPVRELELLQARAGELADPGDGDPAALEHSVELALEMITHIGAAQDWLRSMAEEARLPLVADRGTATPGESDAIFLDTFEAAYQASFAWIAAAFRRLGMQGEDRLFRVLLVALVENNVTITPALKLAIETWIDVGQ